MKKYLITLGLLVSMSFIYASPVNASSGFNAGRIIDDGVFTNSTTMSASDIQSFLNSKVPNCDTYGEKTSEFGGGYDYNGDGRITRAEWGKYNYDQNTFTCLKDYRQNGLSAAQLIYNAAQKYSINPQVLIVLLQKEQGLVTDTWPLNIQYRSATGYGCPDTAACDSQYYGLTNQLNWAATMFRAILNNSPTWFTPYVLGNNYIQYSPDASCGGSTVNIRNRSTQALYNYTPYQPNQATLNAGWGMAHCGAYGNRNFYLYFTGWFGSTYGGDPVSTSVRLTSPITINPASPVAGQDITVSYTVRNFRSTTVTYQNSILQCRYNSKTNCDSNYGGTTSVAPGASRTFTHTVKASGGGNYRLVPFFMEGGIWYRYGIEASTQNSIVLDVPDMRLSSPIKTTPTNLVAGQQATVSYKVKNYSAQPAIYENSVLQCRYEVSTNCDSSYTGTLTIKPGAERTFTHTINIQSGGDYKLTPYFRMDGVWHTYTASSNTIEISVPDLRLTSDISTSPAQPIPGQDMTVSYTMQNFGAKAINYSNTVLQCRFNTRTNCDVDYNAGTVINPGESRTFTHTIPSVEDGSYRLVPYFMYDGQWYEYTKGVAEANRKTVVIQ